MAAIVNTDVSISSTGNIRWTGAATTPKHTVLEFIQYLMDKQDDGQAVGDDLLDITVDTPFNRSTDQILTLNSPFNIDDTFATHLYDGSVSQTEPTLGGETLYSGLGVIGPVVALTEYMILQDGKVLPAFWGTGINPEAAPSLVFSRHLVKSKYAGSKIDGQRITVLARELSDQYRRFPVTLGTGNSVAAIGNGDDIFNTTADATIAGWTITNTEGFQELDIDGTGAAGQEFYSKWNKGSQSINQTYEKTKWISQRSHTAEDSGAQTGTDYAVTSATIVGQAQEFAATAVGEMLTEARLFVKNGGGTPTGTLYCELYDSDDAADAVPTGALLARSEPVLASAITSTYEEIIFRFNRFNPAIPGVNDQLNGLTMTASQQYFIAIKNAEGGAVNFFHVRGNAAGTFANRNKAELTGSWAAQTAGDLDLHVKSSPAIHGVPGEIFQGINIEVGYDGATGVGVAENDLCFWGTKVFYLDPLGDFRPGELVTFRNESGNALKSGGTVLYDDGVNELIVALDTPGAAVIDNDDIITGLTSGATATVDTGAGAILDEDKGGGTGIILAKDPTGTTEVYLQVLTGVNPVNNNRIRKDDVTGDPIADYVDATTVLNTKTVIPEFLGTSTGSNIIGAYGIGFVVADVGSSDRFTSLDGGSSVPPNNVVFTVSGLVSGEDRVLVGPRTGTSLNRGQWLVSTALTLDTETTLVIKTGTDDVPVTAAKKNHPTTGIGADVSRLRIERADGVYARIPYDSFATPNFTLGTPVNAAVQINVSSAALTFTRVSGSFLTDGFELGCTFTGSGFVNAGNNTPNKFTVSTVTATVITVDAVGTMVTETGSGDEVLTSSGWDFLTADTKNAAVDNDVFMAYIDVLASAATATFTGVHTASNDRNLFVRVRDGGGTPIKTFEATSAQFLSTAQTVAATRTSDA